MAFSILNIMDIVSRLKKFIEFTGLPVSQFADNALIPRPTLSQILNGRNKKISNELISKLHDAFPSLNVMWLMFGDGDMLDSRNIEISERQNHPSIESTDSQSSDLTPNESFFTPSSDSFNNFPNNFNGSNSQSGTINNNESARANFMTNADSHNTSKDIGSQTSHRDYDIRPSENKNNLFYSRQQDPDRIMESNSQQRGARQQQFNNSYRQPIPREIQQITAYETTKRITHITVFYSDNSYQIYIPSDSIPE